MAQQAHWKDTLWPTIAASGEGSHTIDWKLKITIMTV